MEGSQWSSKKKKVGLVRNLNKQLWKELKKHLKHYTF